ncbi:MAG: hypothetical protein LW832_03180 [Parachlamydia sp.]|jgi:hypothetical protein|nr:hypothetical protein [Parachlamydia sp.]
MFGIVESACKNYYTQIPEGSLRSIFKSGVYPFVISFVCVNYTKGAALNFTRPLASAAACTLASTIHALTAPFFEWLFENDKFYVHQEIIKFWIDLTLAHSLIHYATPYKVALFTKQSWPLMINIASQNIFKLALVPFITLANAIKVDGHQFLKTKFGVDMSQATPAIYYINPL